MYNDGTFTMEGGAVSGNTAEVSGGVHSTDKVILSGDVQLTGNTGGNLAVYDHGQGTGLYVDGPMENAKVDFSHYVQNEDGDWERSTSGVAVQGLLQHNDAEKLQEMFSEESGLQLDTDGENLVFVTVVELPPKTGDSSQPACGLCSRCSAPRL